MAGARTQEGFLAIREVCRVNEHERHMIDQGRSCFHY
jgi:hypothetical protein